MTLTPHLDALEVLVNRSSGNTDAMNADTVHVTSVRPIVKPTTAPVIIQQLLSYRGPERKPYGYLVGAVVQHIETYACMPTALIVPSVALPAIRQHIRTVTGVYDHSFYFDTHAIRIYTEKDIPGWIYKMDTIYSAA